MLDIIEAEAHLGVARPMVEDISSRSSWLVVIDIARMTHKCRTDEARKVFVYTGAYYEYKGMM